MRTKLRLCAAILAFALAVGTAPMGLATYHYPDPDPVRDPCPTDPAFNATSPRGLPVDASGEDAVHVDIVDFQPFDPATLTIDAGTCVEWHNEGTTDHTVTIVASDNAPLQQTTVAKLAPDEIAHHVFEDPGTYYIHCEINAFHEATMHQVIQVE